MADAEEEIDRLYGLPPGEFTAARNDLAKRLRKEGDREAAERVAGLRRPNAPAAAVNLLVREQRADVDRLMEAGDELREAQEELMSGGDRKRLSAATEGERALLAELVRAAGKGASEAVRQKIEGTLRAAALGDEAREQVLEARLEEEIEPDALGVFGLGGGAAPAAPAKKGGAKKKKPAAKKPPKRDAAEEKRKKKLAELETKLAAEEKREAEARRRHEEAEGAVHDARREADQAAARRDRAEAEEERRRERLDKAAAKAEGVRSEIERLRA